MMAHQMRLEVGARSETGYVRHENQDRMSGSQVPLGQLYIVADGMGGHKGGAVAAELTAQGLQDYLGTVPAHTPVVEAMHTAFQETNTTVYQRAHSGDPATEHMGSTAVVALISGQTARVAHVGDSRAYLYRKGRLTQLTTDHTIVQKMVQEGMLKPEEAMAHPNASVLERAMGSEQRIEVDISDPLSLQDGDALLLCSDGLSSYVTDAEIVSVLRSRTAVQEVSERLVDLALSKGGHDNVTVQFIQYGRRQEAGGRETARLGIQTPSYRLWQLVATFVLGIGLSATAFYVYWQVQMQPQLQEAQRALRTTDANITQMKGEFAALERATQTETNKLRQELEKTKSANTTSQRNLRNLRGQLAQEKRTAQTQVEALQQQLTTATTTATVLQHLLTTAASHTETLQKQSVATDTRLRDLVTKLEQVLAAHNTLQEALQAAGAKQAKKAEQVQSLATATNNATAFHQQLTTAKADAEALQQQFVAAKTRLRDLIAKLEQALAERHTLQEALQAAGVQKAKEPPTATQPAGPSQRLK